MSDLVRGARGIGRDVWRALAGRRWAAVVSIGLLSAGLAVATMAFSLADAMVFHRLPYPHADRIAELRGVSVTGRSTRNLPPEVALEWRRHTDLFSGIHAYEETFVALVSEGRPRYLWVATVTPGLLDALGATPVVGRLLNEGDARPSAATVVIAEDLARANFGDPRLAIGATIPAVSGPMTVVGVVPATFMFPRSAFRAWRAGTVASIGQSSAARFDPHVAILAPGVSIADVNQRLAARSSVVAAVSPRPWPYVTQARPGIAGLAVRPRDSTFVLSLAGVAWCLLLAAWVAVAGIEVAGVSARSRRYAIQLALGATRGRLAAGLCLEALGLFAISTAAATLVSRAGLSVLAANLADVGLSSVFLTNAVDLDTRALGFMSAVAAALWLAVLTPVVLLTGRRSPIEILKRDVRTEAGSGSPVVRRVLTVAQVGFAVALLVLSMLFVRTYASLAGLDKGFDPHGLAVAVWSVSSPRVLTMTEVDALADRLRAHRDIEAVIRVGHDPYSMRGGMPVGVEIDGRGAVSSSNLRMNAVPPEYFEVMRLPIVRGRAFRRDEPSGSVIVSEGFARRFSPDADLLGARVRLDATGLWRDVIGIAASVRHDYDGIASDRPREHEVYEPLGPDPVETRSATLLVRFRGPAAGHVIEDAIRAVDPRAVYGVDLMDDTFAQQIARQRNMMRIASVFAVLALVIAMAGIYDVMSSMVTARTREIGIRVALGASVRDIRLLVLGPTLRLVAAGAVLGVVAAMAGARLVSSLLYGVTPADPLAYTVVPLVLAAVALVAAWPPARRASRVDPAITLRVE